MHKEYFVIYDFSMKSLDAVLKKLPRNVNIGAKNVYGRGSLWSDLIKPAIDSRFTKRILAFLDRPNSNVGFEVGYALGKGKDVILARFEDSLPEWLSYSVLGGHHVEPLKDVGEILEALRKPTPRANQVPENHSFPTRPDTIFLCPSGAPPSIKRRGTNSWRCIAEKNLEELSYQLREGEACRKELEWIITPHGLEWLEAGANPRKEGVRDEPHFKPNGYLHRDGKENAAAAIIAGFAFGRGVKNLRVIRDKRARVPLDLWGMLADFKDVADVKVELGSGNGRKCDPIVKHSERMWHRHWGGGEVKWIENEPFYLCLNPDPIPFLSDSAIDSYGKWEHLTRVNLLARLLRFARGIDGVFRSGGDKEDDRRHLAIIADGGIGKSTNMRWLYGMLAAEGATAVWINLQDLSLGGGSRSGKHNKDGTPWLQSLLIDQLMKVLSKYGSIETEENRAATVSNLLNSESSAGKNNLYVLLDGLDAAPEGFDLMDFVAQVDELNASVIVAGRAYAVWRHLQSLTLETNENLSPFWVIRIQGFEESDAKKYLGNRRYNKIPIAARPMLRVPRTLKYLDALPERLFGQLRTGADIYMTATTELLRENIKRQNVSDEEIEKRLDWTETVLGALAFAQTFCGRGVSESRFGTVELTPELRREVCRMISLSKGKERVNEHDDEIDIEKILELGAAIRLPFFEGKATGQLKVVSWTDRTLHEYYIARWMATECSDAELSTKQWMYIPGRPGSAAYYDINVFLAEMPLKCGGSVSDRRRLDHDRWVRAARRWYLPQPDDLRPSEMIYRSWSSMHEAAGSSFVDWWNVSYQRVLNQKSVKVKKCSEPESLAAVTLNGFLTEFSQRRLTGCEDSMSFVSAERWKRIEGKKFQMGFPKKLQGFPRKTEAYWNEIIDWLAKCARNSHLAVAVCQGIEEAELFPSGSKSANAIKNVHTPLYEPDELIEGAADSNLEMIAEALSEWCNASIWYTDGFGDTFRNEDVKFLKRVFMGVMNAKGTMSAKRDAKTKIANKWRSENETAEESMQSVAGFTMQDVPVLHRWFGMFAPGHKRTVDDFLSEVKEKTVATDLNGFLRVIGLEKSSARESERADSSAEIKGQKRTDPPYIGDHPAILISWFDAWAFCQWARWKDNGNHYQCRLPHEPEWEYAARQGEGGQIKFDQPYWWKGDDIYKTKNTGELEYLFNDRRAHTYMYPGATRNPLEKNESGENFVIGNGFGLRDMLGNVWEWNANPYRDRYSRRHPQSSDEVAVVALRPLRGGTWYFLDLLARCSHRYGLNPQDGDYKMGFRLVREERWFSLDTGE